MGEFSALLRPFPGPFPPLPTAPVVVNIAPMRARVRALAHTRTCLHRHTPKCTQTRVHTRTHARGPLSLAFSGRGVTAGADLKSENSTNSDPERQSSRGLPHRPAPPPTPRPHPVLGRGCREQTRVRTVGGAGAGDCADGSGSGRGSWALCSPETAPAHSFLGPCGQCTLHVCSPAVSG